MTEKRFIETYFDEEPYCDFCGLLEPFDCFVEDADGDDTEFGTLCIDCYAEKIEKFDPVLLKYIRKTELKCKQEYYESLLEEIEEKYKKLI